ncbi:hypothetical protein VTJ83DRAFT_2260 [Remersonia thermophila]|uniref:Tr-type G domain-containing protein n=1 Tax=Remersonia thermophila TaxID=72144 RepID=A0ABR4DI71_9PEZI
MSVFTFDPTPPRVSSPWLRSGDRDKPPASGTASGSSWSGGFGLLSDYGVSKLEPEPQNGPTEYKLHLLLRPRRKYKRISTAARIYGSTQSRHSPDPRTSKSASASPAPSATSAQTRQDRLEHLTTQLLWRLQQSCPYHAGSASPSLVIPQLPEDSSALDAPVKLGKLLPGLEASRGALYEIGVADDGTLVGLTKDEMDESLATLRIMAASLGCDVEVLRMVVVGDCEWVEASGAEDSTSSESEGAPRHAKLWVAEALVTPDLRPRDDAQSPAARSPGTERSAEYIVDPKQGPLTTDQLRVTLTGPTTSGKSTLLGTLSTGSLDNGRGKGRLTLLKHLHEVASGVTSSVAQELVGYHDNNIINYAHGSVESWIDIHDFTKDGRLVYLLDSAGHPRYRRTILRGLIGWAPHWTFLCIAGDNTNSDRVMGTSPGALDASTKVNYDLASVYLDLCLRLGLPLAIVITKLDLADKASLATTLRKVLSSLKAAGRVPKMVKTGSVSQLDHDRVSELDKEAVRDALECMRRADNPASIVPILLTSAVDGRGIGAVHALLQGLPLPPTPTPHDYIGAALNPEQPACLFHIEDKFSLPASYTLATSDTDQSTDRGTVVAGYLRFGSLSIGDKVVVGPFPPTEDDPHSTTPDERIHSDTPQSYGLSVSHPSSAELSRRNPVSASATSGEWHTATIVSIRNLRLPVQTLAAGQVGSIGMVFDPRPDSTSGHSRGGKSPALRKGMVLAVPSQHMVSSGLSLQAVSGLTAVFDTENQGAGSLAVGSLVNIYVASVRSAARVVRVSRVNDQLGDDAGVKTAVADVEEGLFGLAEDMDGVEAVQAQDVVVGGSVEMQLELLSTREWVELGSRILVLEGGNKDRSGLEGYVGKVVEIVE